MKKFILNIFIFLIFSVFFYLVALFIWGCFAPNSLKPNVSYNIGAYGHLYSRISEAKSQSDLDILFLGSSHAYRGFDTRIFSKYGYKTFNLGSSAQTPIQTKVLLDRYLDTLNPEIVIYEVYPETFTVDGVESSLDIISNDKNDLYSFEMTLRANNIKTYNTFIYGLARDLFNLNKSFTESQIKGNDTYISGGYVEKEIGFFKPTLFERKEIIVKDYQLESFSEIVQVIKIRNIELILVYAPITKCNYDSYINNSYFDSLMSVYSEYYNFNEIISLNDSLHFNDAHHLNQNGVVVFNRKLIEVLKEKKITNIFQ